MLTWKAIHRFIIVYTISNLQYLVEERRRCHQFETFLGTSLVFFQTFNVSLKTNTDLSLSVRQSHLKVLLKTVTPRLLGPSSECLTQLVRGGLWNLLFYQSWAEDHALTTTGPVGI